MASAAADSPAGAIHSQSPGMNGEAHLDNGLGEDHLEANEYLEDEQDDADLFGDEDGGGQPENDANRMLDDSELDSGDDMNRRDRLQDTVEDEQDYDDVAQQHDVHFLTLDLGRVQAPHTDDDQLYLLNLPPFVGLSDADFNPETYQPPKMPHDGQEPVEGKFSAFSTAATTMYWRHDPKNSGRLQSNSRIIRWSDGSLTLQMATRPKEQYRISTTALRHTFGKKNKASTQNDYDPSKDAQAYLAVPHSRDDLLQITAPFSAAMKILPTGEQTDESVIRLQNSLAAANATHDPFAAVKHVKEDPELAKKAAELAERDIMRAKRRQQNAEDKQFSRRDRVLGRSGLSRGAGLSVAGLEDEDGMPTTARPKKAKPRRNQRGDIYSEDEDEGYPRNRTKEDEYDLDDGFMAASDEEPEIYDDVDAPGEDDDPDVDDLEIEGRETVVAGKTRGEQDRAGREETPKRSREGGDEAAPTSGGSPHAGRKKRRVIDDDDDDE